MCVLIHVLHINDNIHCVRKKLCIFIRKERRDLQFFYFLNINIMLYSRASLLSYVCETMFMNAYSLNHRIQYHTKIRTLDIILV